MTSTLSIAETEYLQSADIAQQFGYTKDYVSKLAREGVVTGEKVGRVWYVDPSSFKSFVQEREKNKQKRSADLRAERLVERRAHETEHVLIPVPVAAKVTSQHHAFLQTVAVVFCGVFLGVLGFVVQQEGLGAHDLAAGARNMAAVMAAHTVSFGSIAEVSQKSAVVPTAVSTLVPQRQPQQPISATSSLDFSDPVQVQFVRDGVAEVQPVFRDGKTGRTYRVDISTTSTATSTTQ